MTSKWMIRVGLALVVVGGWQVVKAHLREDGAVRAEIKATQQRYDALEERGVVYDTLYVPQKAAVIKYVTRWDTVSKVQNITDTVWVKSTLLLADSTINACSEALNTCEHRVAIRDSMIGLLSRQVALERKRRPGFFAQLGQKVIWAGIGFGAAKVLSR